MNNKILKQILKNQIVQLGVSLGTNADEEMFEAREESKELFNKDVKEPKNEKSFTESEVEKLCGLSIDLYKELKKGRKNNE